MANFKEVFRNPRVILPVIHTETPSQAIVNAMMAEKLGCDGVFLIDMRGRGHLNLFSIYKAVRAKMPDFWIGVNCLDLYPAAAFDKLPSGINGYWADNGGVYDYGSTEAAVIKKAREESGWDGLYFGGTAFKYQNSVKDVAMAAKVAAWYMDVVTTSGEGTGFAPNTEKIIKMKQAIADFPLAIASGMSPDNIQDYLEYSDCFIVASSLLLPDGNFFDPLKLESFVSKVRKFKP